MLAKLEGKIIDVENFGFSQENLMKIRLKKCFVKVKEWKLKRKRNYDFFDYVYVKKVINSDSSCFDSLKLKVLFLISESETWVWLMRIQECCEVQHDDSH